MVSANGKILHALIFRPLDWEHTHSSFYTLRRARAPRSKQSAGLVAMHYGVGHRRRHLLLRNQPPVIIVAATHRCLALWIYIYILNAVIA